MEDMMHDAGYMIHAGNAAVVGFSSCIKYLASCIF
jgi:hypothetical protein